MFYKIYYNLVDICPPSCIQHANHISSRTDHPLMYFNNNQSQFIFYKYSFFFLLYEYLELSPLLSCFTHVSFVDNSYKLAVPVIRAMQLIFGGSISKI